MTCVCFRVSVGIKMALLHIVLFAALFATGFAEVVKTSKCPESNDDVCTVSQVRIMPCPQLKKCRLQKGSNATISFDFTPNFATSELKIMVYLAYTKELDIPIFGLGSDEACGYTSCPTVPGQKQTLNYTVHVRRILPSGAYPLKWKVWDTEKETEHVCCFKTSIKLVK